MFNRSLIFFIITFIIISCKNEKTITAKNIIDKSIAISGGDKIKSSTINFDFRDKHYKAIRHNGEYQLERMFKDSTGIITDILSNNGFQRFVNNDLFKVSDSMIHRYSASVNSVHYFSVLPFGLNNKAVNKKYIGLVDLKGQTYYKIEVTFNQNGGGEDFEDVFIYWIDNKEFKVDYLAYSYNKSDGIGLRFREAYNERYIHGIRFVDYNNYKPKNNKITLLDLDKSFENNQLELLSKIELKNIKAR